jgi:glycosyltransferase involved in cell wall biosynthesis
MKPFFSVIIPALNEEDYLPKLLSDLKKQKYKDFEIIIIDGGSTDRTVEIVKNFEKKLRIKFYISPKRNVSYQRNLGAKRSKGNFLVFLDADSRIKSNFLNSCFKLIERKKGLLFIPKIIPQEKTKKTSEIKVIFEAVNFLIEVSQLTNKPFSSGGNIIIEKNLFLFLDGFDEKLFLAEDHNLIQKAKKAGVGAKIFPDITVKFSLRRMHREGRLKFLYKNILAIFHILFKGDIKKKIFEYPMGGGLSLKQNELNSFFNLKKYLKTFRQILKRF